MSYIHFDKNISKLIEFQRDCAIVTSTLIFNRIGID